MFAGGITWNRMEPVNKLTQIKTLIGWYCVYNIISLPNKTLQIPIVKKSFILDVDKVSQIRLCFIYTLHKKSKTFNENKARDEQLW